MMQRVVVVTPAKPVVTVEEARDHLRVDGYDEDALIQGFVAAATAHIDGPDGWLGRAIGAQTLELGLPAFGTTSIALPFPPALDIVSIAYVTPDGAVTTLGTDAVELVGSLLRPAWPTSFPTAQWRGAGGEAVRIQYRAGYEKLPPAIRVAILLMTEDLYRNRGEAVVGASTASVQMAPTVEAMLTPFRVYT